MNQPFTSALRFDVVAGLTAAAVVLPKAMAYASVAGLPVAVENIPGPKLSVDELMRHIAQDKKVKRGKLTFILTRGIGKAFIANDVPPEKVQKFLAGQLRH